MTRKPNLLSPIQSLRDFTVSHSKSLLLIGLTTIMVGGVLSVRQLDLSWRDVDLVWLGVLLLGLGPLGLLYGALNMVVMARGAGVHLGPVEALRIASISQIAEFLPLPGGALVRGGALMIRGSKGTDAAAHVVVNALLWVACAGIAAGLALGWESHIGLPILGFSFVGLLLCLSWLRSRAGMALATAAFSTRLIGLAILGLKLLVAFAVIGQMIELSETYPFAFASILGSASSIAPGGLGISEVLAASLATFTQIAPSAAFLAVAINRICGLLASGIAAFALTMSKNPVEGADG